MPRPFIICQAYDWHNYPNSADSWNPRDQEKESDEKTLHLHFSGFLEKPNSLGQQFLIRCNWIGLRKRQNEPNTSNAAWHCWFFGWSAVESRCCNCLTVGRFTEVWMAGISTWAFRTTSWVKNWSMLFAPCLNKKQRTLLTLVDVEKGWIKKDFKRCSLKTWDDFQTFLSDSCLKVL